MKRRITLTTEGLSHNELVEIHREIEKLLAGRLGMAPAKTRCAGDYSSVSIVFDEIPER